MNRETRARWVSGVLVAVVLAALLPGLSTTLDDIDPINFALGVRDFDPTRHQPHPPGYPIYIVLAKLSTATIDLVRPEPNAGPVAGQKNAARGLAIWSALAGALSLLPLLALFRRVASPIGAAPDPAAGGAASWRWRTIDPIAARYVTAGAAALTIASPLFWFTSLRPLSDVPGLVGAVVAQVAILAARAKSPDGPADRRGRIVAWALAGLATALIVGVRSQTLWLTVPLFGVAILRPLRAGRWEVAGGALAGLAVGALAWAVPLVVETGGPEVYLAALRSQGREDFTGVDMLFRQPTPRRLAVGLLHTFIWPWALTPLAVAMIAGALLGAGWLLRRSPRTLGWLAVAFGPYALFHLVFHETITTRYALPLVVPMACLASAGAWAVTRRLQPLVVAAACVAGLAVAMPASWNYAALGSPIERAVGAMAARAASYKPLPVLAMHERPYRDSRRALQWMLDGRTFWSERFPATPGLEVRQVIDAWVRGERRPVWFVANPGRADLPLIDPAAVHLLGDFDWPFASNTFAGNTRPGRVLWYELTAPGWFLGRGWAITPELAGADARDRRGPSLGPVEAWVRRRAGAATLMIGGRDLAHPGTAPGRLDLSLDGRPLTSIAARRDQGYYLQFVPLAPGTLAGEGDYARLTAVAAAEDGKGGATSVAIEQFDLQDEGNVMFGYERGWHEPEYNPTTGRRWRWTSDRAALQTHPGGGDVIVRVSGESPLRYYDRAPVVSLTVDGREVHRVEPRRDFSFEAVVPHDALAAAAGRIWLTTDLSFVPAEREGNGDRRRLGLRIWDVTVAPLPAPR